jgi:LysM repeat protein
VKSTEENGVLNKTVYIRDANGNIMAVYEYKQNQWRWTEQHLYGAERLGVHYTGEDWDAAMADEDLTPDPGVVGVTASGLFYLPSTNTFMVGQSNFKGRKNYELTNHTSTTLSDRLGNVMAVVSDRLTKYSVVEAGVIPYSLPNMVSATDYDPFGMALEERVWQLSGVEEYGFSFNTQLKSPEIGDGHTTAMYWEYDARIGRRWELDPVVIPNESPYATFRSNPILFNDVLGDCPDCRDGQYEIKSGDMFSKLENAWGMTKGTLQSYNPGIDPANLKVGSKINVSPTLVNARSNGGDFIDLQTGATNLAATDLTFDEDFTLDPNAVATTFDRASWSAWGAGATVARAQGQDNAAVAYEHYRENTGTVLPFSYEEFIREDAAGATTIANLDHVLLANLPRVLPYAGTRNFYTNVLVTGSPSFPGAQTTNWQRTIGQYNFWITGTITAKDVSGNLSYTINYTLHAVDRYNFNRNNEDIASGVDDNANGRFATLGWARSFLSTSLFRKTL